MTTTHTETSKSLTSKSAFPAGPWTGRTLDQSETIVRQYAMAYERKRTAEAEFKQAEASLKHAHSEGLLEGHFDDLSETYEFESVRFVVAEGRKSYPIDVYSESTQALIKEERLNGAFRIGEKSLKPKFRDA